jgi:hypothetical protein
MRSKGCAKTAFFRIVALAMACFFPIFSVGCTKADLDKTVALIGAELPTALQLALQVATIVAAFGNPPGTTAKDKIVAGIKEVEVLVTAYQANPSQSAFDQIVKAFNEVIATSEDQLLSASQITDQNSRKEAVAILGSLNATLLVIDGYVQATQTTTQVKATAHTRKAKLERLQSLINIQYMDQKFKVQGHSYQQYYAHETAMGF